MYFPVGGDLLTSPQIVVVYWGAQRSGLPSFMDQFYSRITQSTYLAPLSEYNLPGKIIGTARYVTSVSILPGMPAPWIH